MLDTSKVTNMLEMFYMCATVAELDLSNFNTSNVINMLGMFSSCSKLTSLDLDGFDTSKVTNMVKMFYYCGNLQSIFVSDKWAINEGCDTTDMFTSCGVSSVTYV